MNRPLEGVTVLEDPADAAVGPVRLGVPTPFYVPPGEVVISAPTATPAFTASAPTPWPTRIPAGLTPRGAAAEPAGTPVPPTPRLPPPLTPIVTTPTPRSPRRRRCLPRGALPHRNRPSRRKPRLRAGNRCFRGPGRWRAVGPESVLTPAPVIIWPTPTATPRPPARTPRPDLTPILLRVDATPTPTATPESPLSRFWREVLERVMP